MKGLIQKLCHMFGYEISRHVPKAKRVVNIDTIIPEITESEKEMIATSLQYSMTNPERMWAIVQSMKYLVSKKIEGDVVECGVWKGGNILLFTLLLEFFNVKKPVWAYDTYEGMSLPTDNDVDFRGTHSKELLVKAPRIAEEGTHNIWCYSTLDEVVGNVQRHAQSVDAIRFIKGKVEETLMDEKNLPDKISLLRIDTDWYESTKKCLEVLYPRLVSGGVLILDDYGHWKGSRKAFDEYFAERGEKPFLHRVDYTCRLMIKE
jgi:O-methyltransferase